MQNDVTLRVTNSNSFIEILLWSYSIEAAKEKVLFQVTNPITKLLFYYLQVTNSRLKNKNFH